MEPLTVEAAQAEARAAGVAARLLVGLRPAGQSFLLGLTTSDSEPRLELVRGQGPSRRVDLLDQRHSSGPDRWDYPLRLSELREVFLVRLTRGESIRDVPVLPAAGTLLREHGWNEATLDMFGEPLLDVSGFRRALNGILETAQ